MAASVGLEAYTFIAELYDHVTPYRDRGDVDFYSAAAKSAGGPVLEVACGTGRILIPSARAGVRITGIDGSPHMLAMCRERLRRESADVQARVDLAVADMRDFALSRTYSMVTIPFRPFQHLITVEDQLACLACVAKHLEDGGRLVMDVFNPSIEVLANRKLGEEFGEEPEFTMPDGRRVVRRHKIVAHDRFQQVNHVEMAYDITHPDGRTERRVHSFPMRYLYRYELEHLLARSGFEVEQLLADFEGTPFGSKYPCELVVVARKRGG